MIRRVLVVLPLLVLLAITSVVFLAAHAPRTWAANWTVPGKVASGTGENEFGAVHVGTSGWDLLTVDDELQQLMYTRDQPPGAAWRSVVDRGDVLQPALVRVGRSEVGIWIRNLNGATQLRAAYLNQQGPSRPFTLIQSPEPIEHPAIVRGARGGVDIVFAWQRNGNFDLFRGTLTARSAHFSAVQRLVRAEFYAFYPRVARGIDGNLGVLYLNDCCKQQIWNVVFTEYNAAGRQVGPARVLYRIRQFGADKPIPSQWAEDLRVDARGNFWGAFAGDAGIWVFKAGRSGHILSGPTDVDPFADLSPALALAVGQRGGTVFWEQHHDLGAYIQSQRFNAAATPVGSSERVAYESGSETNPHAWGSAKAQVLWQTVSRPMGSLFESSSHRPYTRPTIAQRLGLGLGDPWEEMAILVVSALGVATLVTTTNILLVIAMALAGILMMRLLRRVPGRWTIYGCVLAVALYLAFVGPGGPTIFLGTIPSMGIQAEPFGLLATAGALFFTSWTGYFALRRIDDVYRAGIMAYLGVYFFAFLESAVFIQQRLGYL